MATLRVDDRPHLGLGDRRPTWVVAVKRIFAWQTDGSACYYYRLWLPLSHLPADRFSYQIGAPGPDVHDYDVVIGQRIGGDSELWQNLCRDPNVLAVYDIDDDLLNIDPENAVPHSIYAPLRDGTQRNIEMSDVITASTPKLAEYLSQFNSNVLVVRNCVPDALPDTPRRPLHGLTVGWGGSMFHQQDWHFMIDVLRQLRRLHPGIALRTIGANYMHGFTNVSTSGFSTVDTYHRELDFHIGLAPLVDTPFNQRKSWIKTLEYAARGIPCAASEVGQYDEWVEHGRNGYLVGPTDQGEWVAAIDALCDDGVRTMLGEAALAKSREWTISRRIQDWISAYDK